MLPAQKKWLSSVFLIILILSGLFLVFEAQVSIEQSLSPPTVSLGIPQIYGLTVSVNGATMPTTPGATITQISFDWGNGATTIGWFPQIYTYSLNGTYTINVTSTDSNGLSGSASTEVSVQGPTSTPSPTPSPIPTPPPVIENYSTQNFPISISYNTYPRIGAGITLSSGSDADPCAISVGVMNGSASVQVSQGNQMILSTTVTGEAFNYVVTSASSGYAYANFYSNGQPLLIKAVPTSGNPLIADNVYNNYITNSTASLITYPPQFAANFGPPTTPVNTGISFFLVAPHYQEPTPLAIWIGEGWSWG